MSSIRITVGHATVELESIADRRDGQRGATEPTWPTDDLITATARALDAAYDARADTLRHIAKGTL